jgi:mono/diheme cytochrome c family protein/plastocyanin
LEFFALSVVLLVLVAFPASLFGYQAWRHRQAPGGVRIVEIVARNPAEGGFMPDRIDLKAGETVKLRLTSRDAIHGLTIPGLDVNVAEIYPGKVVEVTVTPDKPGRYAFACTSWCGVDHWRMRGVIEVTGEAAALPTKEPPLFQQLGIDLDAELTAAHVTPGAQPSVAVGAALNAELPQELADPLRRRALPPYGAFETLRSDPANAALSDDDVWSLVAWAWLKDARLAGLARAQSLYARDCAACHGVDGKGGDPADKDLPGMQEIHASTTNGPSDFTDAGMMLAASDARLQGKLLRGGMGTGMPEFGSLYTDEELWALIAYLRTFLFKP